MMGMKMTERLEEGIQGRRWEEWDEGMEVEGGDKNMTERTKVRGRKWYD